MSIGVISMFQTLKYSSMFPVCLNLLSFMWIVAKFYPIIYEFSFNFPYNNPKGTAKMLSLKGRRTYTGNAKNLIYTFLTKMFRSDPAINPPTA